MKLQPLLTDALQRNAAHSVTFLTVSPKALPGLALPCCLRPFVHCISTYRAVMAHVYACHIQQICNMIKGRERTEIRGARGTLINKRAKLNCPSLPMRCSVKLNEMELQNSSCTHTTNKVLHKFVNCESELWLSTQGRAIQEA